MSPGYITADETYEITYLDPSSLCSYNRCPALYLLKRLMSLTSPESFTIAMDFGTCLHRALPHCYEDIGVVKAMEEFKTAWLEFGHGEADPKRNCFRAHAMLADFARLHSAKPYEIISPTIRYEASDIISPNEVPFLVDIGADLPIAGRADLMVSLNSDGSRWIDDYKSAGEITTRSKSNFEFSPQACGYTLGISALTGERFRGLLLEFLRVSESRSETVMHFVHVSDEQLETYAELAKRTSERILHSNSAKTWQKNCSACAPYGQFGSYGYLCDYVEICQAPDWHDALSNFVTKERYHPFEMNNEETEKD